MAQRLGTLVCSSILSLHTVLHSRLAPRNLVPFSQLYGYQAYLCRHTCKETHAHTKYTHGGVLIIPAETGLGLATQPCLFGKFQASESQSKKK